MPITLLPIVLLSIMIASEFVLCAFPAMLWVFLGRQRWSEAFSWRRPCWQEMVGAVFLAFGMVYCVPIEVIVQNHFIPSLAAGVKTSMSIFIPVMEQYPWVLIIAVPLSAAICEELFFRGPLQQALLRRLPTWTALSVGALIFAFVHLDIVGLVARVALGLMFGWMVLRGGSIFPAMLMHFVYDAALYGSNIWELRMYGETYMLEAAGDPKFGVTRSTFLIDTAIGAALLMVGFRILGIAYKRKAALQSATTPVETPVEVGHD